MRLRAKLDSTKNESKTNAFLMSKTFRFWNDLAMGILNDFQCQTALYLAFYGSVFEPIWQWKNVCKSFTNLVTILSVFLKCKNMYVSARRSHELKCMWLMLFAVGKSFSFYPLVICEWWWSFFNVDIFIRWKNSFCFHISRLGSDVFTLLISLTKLFFCPT